MIKKGKLNGDIFQMDSTYDYQDMDSALLGVVGQSIFGQRRIQVVQMI